MRTKLFVDQSKYVIDLILNMEWKSLKMSYSNLATYVQRGSCEDMTEEESAPPREFLSDFQKVKLTYFFQQVLDMNKDDVISASDFVALNQVGITKVLINDKVSWESFPCSIY